MNQILDLIIILIIFSIIMIILSINPIHSIFWLILTFLFSSSLFLSLNLDYIPFIVIIIYIGAITILFLFVIMMIEIIDIIKVTSIYNILPFLIIMNINIILKILLFKNYKPKLYNNWHFNNYNSIYDISNILYTKNYFFLLLLSILLLIAMIGAISLTLEINEITRKQQLITQHQRNCT
uniref:NADH dehydrogenase subunit 6 n=1 Tax=Praya dubia TaxID=316184 RepID=UPI0026E1BD95|nr:NADH dehydrogenase subunit 6 [Praya dubia]WJJ70089.1 NADH dehydrogenase subunit 6 [Praya dubia]